MPVAWAMNCCCWRRCRSAHPSLVRRVRPPLLPVQHSAAHYLCMRLMRSCAPACRRAVPLICARIQTLRHTRGTRAVLSGQLTMSADVSAKHLFHLAPAEALQSAQASGQAYTPATYEQVRRSTVHVRCLPCATLQSCQLTPMRLCAAGWIHTPDR